MKKLFISQPMNGMTNEEIIETRNRIINNVENRVGEKVEVLDSFFPNFDGNCLAFIGKSIEVLSEADIAYFAKGWDTRRGCKIEHTCAIEYGGISIIYEDDDSGKSSKTI